MTPITPPNADLVPVSTKLIGHKVLRPRQQVEESLREAILSGQLEPGERLPAETELARQFSVSRPTIREALSALETQGLIKKVPGAGGGSFVQAVDHHALGQVVQESVHNLLLLGTIEYSEVAMVREYLEAPSVMLAAQHRTEEDLEHLRAVIEDQRTRSIDDEKLPELDAEFHMSIARMSGNRILASLIAALHRESERANRLDLTPETGRTTFRQHVAIYTAIAESDPEAGREAIITHLTYLREHLAPPVSDESTD